LLINRADEFIGERTLSLSALPNGLLHESWMSLLPKGFGKSIFSKAHVKIRYKPSTDDTPNLFVTCTFLVLALLIRL